jgi:hypothetical protein
MVDEQGNPVPVPAPAPIEMEVVWPAGWLRDEHHRGLTYLEMTTLGSVSTECDIEDPPTEKAA